MLSLGKVWFLVYIINPTLVLARFNLSPLHSIKCFQAAYQVSNSSKLSVIITKSLAYNICQYTVLLHYLRRASRTITNNKGLNPNDEPNRTLMMNPYLHIKLVSHSVAYLITLLLFLYIVITTLINHSSAPNFLITHLTT